jgi:hypothetical protein
MDGEMAVEERVETLHALNVDCVVICGTDVFVWRRMPLFVLRDGIRQQDILVEEEAQSTAT